MLIGNLIKKLQEIEAINPNSSCSVYIHNTESDGVDQCLESNELPTFVFLDSDPNSVMVDFYTSNWKRDNEE